MPPRLRIVAVNDVYSLRHLPRLTSLVRHHATHDPADRLLVVMAGDFLAPSVLSSLDSGRGMVDCLNHVPMTHVILGNHEDDIEPEHLRARIRELAATVILTNVHGLDESRPKYDIIDVGGVRVGLVGVTSAEAALYRRPPFGGARLEDANEAARRVADELLAGGCACVIPITHQRVADDRALARTEFIGGAFRAPPPVGSESRRGPPPESESFGAPHLRVRPFAPRRGPSTTPEWNRPSRNGRSPWSRTIPRRTTSARSARSHGHRYAMAWSPVRAGDSSTAFESTRAQRVATNGGREGHSPSLGDESLGDLSTAIEPPFPVIVGGHEHDGLLERIGSTWLTKAPSEAVKATVIDLMWDDGVSFPEVHARFEDVSAYPEDEAMRARVEKHLAKVRELETATILLLSPGESLSSIGTRVRQTSMGALICSSLRDALDADGAIFNGGGIRGGRTYEGRLTYGDVRNEVPFDNEIAVVALPGSVLRDAIAASRAKAPAESGGFLQVDDRMRVDDAHRLTHVGGEPFDAARSYRIAVVRNLFEGLDRVEPLMRFAKEHPDAIPMATTGREVKIALVGAFASRLWDQLGGFEGIDANADGQVTSEEIVEALARVGGGDRSTTAARVVLEAIDHDEDGVVTPSDLSRRR